LVADQLYGNHGKNTLDGAPGKGSLDPCLSGSRLAAATGIVTVDPMGGQIRRAKNTLFAK